MHIRTVGNYCAHSKRQGIEALPHRIREGAGVDLAEVWLQQIPHALRSPRQGHGVHYHKHYEHKEHGNGELAEFLYSEGLITQDDVRCVLDFCFAEYLVNIQNKDTSYVPSMMDVVSFTSYAELKYARTSYTMLMKYVNRFRIDVSEEATSKFYKLSNRWYRYLTDNFVKVAVMNNSVEFRICSEDSFDWNSVIIDDCILEYDLSSNSSTRYSILRESSKGYKAYFLNATLKEILESDSTILSSSNYTYLDRRIVDEHFIYSKKWI